MTMSPAVQSATIKTALAMSEQSMTMMRALRHYNGQGKRALMPRVGDVDDNIQLGLGRLVCDAGVNALFGQDCPSQVTGPQPEAKQDWLDECWRRNKRMLTLSKLSTNGAICGHTFARLIPSAPWPRVVVLDPMMVTIKTSNDDIEDVWRFTVVSPQPPPDDEGEPPPQRRTVIENQSGQAGYKVDMPEQWTITDQEFHGGTWQTTASTIWPYAFCPIAHCQHLPKPNDPYGTPDLTEDVMHILDALSRVASMINKTLRHFAHPILYSTGMGARQLDRSIDSVLHLPSEAAQLKIVEMQSDLSSSLATWDKLFENLCMITHLPAVVLGRPDGLGAPSGVAMKIRYGPLVARTEQKRRTYGDMIEEIDRRLLAIGGFGDSTLTQIKWPSIVPVSDIEERQVAVIDDSLAIMSKQGIAERFDIDYEAEKKEMDKEKADAVEQAQQAMGPGTPVITAQGDGTVPPPQPLNGPVPSVAKGTKEP